MASKMKIAFLLLFALFFLSSFSQSKVDTLIGQFKNTPTETERISILRNIKVVLDDLEKQDAVYYWDNLITFCDKSDFIKESGFCSYNKAIRLNNEGDYFESFLAYQESKNRYSEIKFKSGLARVYNGLGNLFNNLNKSDQSLNNYYKSAELFKELNDSSYAKIYLNIGGILAELDSLHKAKEFLEKSRVILLAAKDSSGLVNCFINLSEVYIAEDKSDSAFHYLIQSHAYSGGNVDVSDKFNATYHLGEFYLNSGDTSLAKPLLTEAFRLIENNPDKNSINVEYRAKAIKALSELMEKTGDTVNAYYFLKKYIEYQTETKREQSNLDLSQMEFENMENLSKLERNRRMWTMYISIAGLLGSVLLFLAFYRSYKHKQEANRLLTEMDELKNRLYSNITHELRTPLTLILGPLEQMLSSETEKTPSHKQVKMMRKNANSLLTLVNQMLDLTKIDAKSMKLELVEEDINKFLRTRFAAFASLAEQKSITYQFSLLNEKNIRIFDASKLEKIINNLVSNAVKFTGENGKISCYANFHQPNTLELIVEDDGKGIPKDELDEIFNRFHQVKSRDEVINIGTGIGLSLTKELVTLMHGKIEVESEVEKGSKFTVTLPLGKEHLNEDEFQLVQNLNSKAHETCQIKKPDDIADECVNIQDSDKENESLPHILIVEDHADIREFIAENLKDCFFVEQAENGKTGLESAIKNIPDLVITDIVMPKMDGIEMCRNLKTDEKTSHIPVVMLTGKSGIEDRLLGLDTGADAYLTKPFNIKELRLQVTKLIEQRKKLRERFTRELHLEPRDIAVTSADEKFINRAMEIIEKNIGNSEFEVRHFEEEMFMSRMQLFRKIKALTNQTPGDFIRTIRLKRAASLIKQNFGNIAQITFEVGFNNPSYFAKCFKDLYGVLPSDYLKNHN
jgi:signal transduction histidine kinase/DNA-binding response OmpR family regulator